MTDIPELLPCPFCGGVARLSAAMAGHEGLSPTARNPRCRDCGCDLGYCLDARHAIAAWNTRPTPGPVTITPDLMAAGASNKGSWNKWQTMALGVPWPLESGWKKAVMGKDISATAAAKFIALKNAHMPATPPTEEDEA